MVVLLAYYICTLTSLNLVIYCTVGGAFLFAVDISTCPVLSAIGSQTLST